MAGVGYYRMQRGWQEGALFGSEAYSRRDAWTWLIEEAAYTPREMLISGKAVTIGRGQLCHSLRFMAKAWKWDEAKVRRFLKRAQELRQIDAETDAGQTIITICNYEKYQAPLNDNDAADDAVATQERRSSDANKKEGKEIKKEKISAAAPSDYAFAGSVIRLLPSQFDKWALAYPGLDLRATLQSRDDWLSTKADEATRKNWFMSTSNHLANLHNQAAKPRAAVPEEFRI